MVANVTLMFANFKKTLLTLLADLGPYLFTQNFSMSGHLNVFISQVKQEQVV